MAHPLNVSVFNGDSTPPQTQTFKPLRRSDSSSTNLTDLVDRTLSASPRPSSPGSRSCASSPRPRSSSPLSRRMSPIQAPKYESDASRIRVLLRHKADIMAKRTKEQAAIDPDSAVYDGMKNIDGFWQDSSMQPTLKTIKYLYAEVLANAPDSQPRLAPIAEEAIPVDQVHVTLETMLKHIERKDWLEKHEDTLWNKQLDPDKELYYQLVNMDVYAINNPFDADLNAYSDLWCFDNEATMATQLRDCYSKLFLRKSSSEFIARRENDRKNPGTPDPYGSAFTITQIEELASIPEGVSAPFAMPPPKFTLTIPLQDRPNWLALHRGEILKANDPAEQIFTSLDFYHEILDGFMNNDILWEGTDEEIVAKIRHSYFQDLRFIFNDRVGFLNNPINYEAITKNISPELLETDLQQQHLKKLVFENELWGIENTEEQALAFAEVYKEILTKILDARKAVYLNPDRLFEHFPGGAHANRLLIETDRNKEILWNLLCYHDLELADMEHHIEVLAKEYYQDLLRVYTANRLTFERTVVLSKLNDEIARVDSPEEERLLVLDSDLKIYLTLTALKEGWRDNSAIPDILKLRQAYFQQLRNTFDARMRILTGYYATIIQNFPDDIDIRVHESLNQYDHDHRYRDSLIYNKEIWDLNLDVDPLLEALGAAYCQKLQGLVQNNQDFIDQNLGAIFRLIQPQELLGYDSDWSELSNLKYKGNLFGRPNQIQIIAATYEEKLKKLQELYVFVNTHFEALAPGQEHSDEVCAALYQIARENNVNVNNIAASIQTIRKEYRAPLIQARKDKLNPYYPEIAQAIAHKPQLKIVENLRQKFYQLTEMDALWNGPIDVAKFQEAYTDILKAAVKKELWPKRRAWLDNHINYICTGLITTDEFEKFKDEFIDKNNIKLGGRLQYLWDDKMLPQYRIEIIRSFIKKKAGSAAAAK